MNRRRFLVAAGAFAASARWARPAWAADIPRDVRITRAVGFDLACRRSKVAGKNARLDVHGDSATDRMVRLFTSAGVEGLGNCRADEAAVAELVGKPLADCFDPTGPRATVLGAATMPIWDLAGKVLKQPAYQLFGGRGPERVKVYDGSIYFADLLPQFAERPLDRFKEEVDMGRELGHRAFKIKIGRGAKWMDRAAGDRRDIDVVRTIREHAGPDVTLGVDANNGYDLAGAKRFLDEAGPLKLAFAEEMFPETVEECLEFKAFIREQGFDTLLADGETQSELDVFKPFIERQAIDVLQGDMNHFGFEGILQEAAWAQPQGIRVAPHNWGSLVGFYMQLHVGRAIENLYMAEHDPLTADMLTVEGYEIADGAASVPDAPGFGLALDEEKFKSRAKIRFDLS
jgi:L-alanine-DL-glutamate epimerase-like enolase superfamily enzyme